MKKLRPRPEKGLTQGTCGAHLFSVVCLMSEIVPGASLRCSWDGPFVPWSRTQNLEAGARAYTTHQSCLLSPPPVSVAAVLDSSNSPLPASTHLECSMYPAFFRSAWCSLRSSHCLSSDTAWRCGRGWRCEGGWPEHIPLGQIPANGEWELVSDCSSPAFQGAVLGGN